MGQDAILSHHSNALSRLGSYSSIRFAAGAIAGSFVGNGKRPLVELVRKRVDVCGRRASFGHKARFGLKTPTPLRPFWKNSSVSLRPNVLNTFERKWRPLVVRLEVRTENLLP